MFIQLAYQNADKHNQMYYNHVLFCYMNSLIIEGLL